MAEPTVVAAAISASAAVVSAIVTITPTVLKGRYDLRVLQSSHPQHPVHQPARQHGRRFLWPILTLIFAVIAGVLFLDSRSAKTEESEPEPSPKLRAVKKSTEQKVNEFSDALYGDLAANRGDETILPKYYDFPITFFRTPAKDSSQLKDLVWDQHPDKNYEVPRFANECRSDDAVLVVHNTVDWHYVTGDEAYEPQKPDNQRVTYTVTDAGLKIKDIRTGKCP